MKNKELELQKKTGRNQRNINERKQRREKVKVRNEDDREGDEEGNRKRNEGC